MKQRYFKIIKFLSIVIGLIVLSFVTFLTFISVKDYTPSSIISLQIHGKLITKIDSLSTFSLMSWNMGYSGLGKEMDFFYDGGEMVRATKKRYEKYLNENISILQMQSNVDFIFLQEVDVDSKRSYHKNQAVLIRQALPKFEYSFAKNYEVGFVPIPPTNPMGKVNAGIMSMSRFSAFSAKRHAYPNIASWPDKLFLLDRCFIVSRYKVDEKELVLINTHNSYYVNEDSLRMIELNILKEVLIEEYQKGNYVIAGGDWNKLPPINVNELGIEKGRIQADVSHIDPDFLPIEWQWAFDPNTPTNRELNTAYTDQSKLSIIDYFVCSPNVEIISKKTIDLNFENSDHNPVVLKFKLIY